jgi:class III poly(R)-hydroxyalkanoic acid synthase PhaE subunit
MANQGSGGAGSAGGDDFEALARQYWSQWGEMLRASGAMPGSTPGMAAAAGIPGGPQAAIPGWNETVDRWARLAGGAGQPADDAMGRFGAQASGWYARMQQLAAQFAGQQGSAAEIAAAWRNALGATGGNPFAEVMRGMQGPGQQDFGQWLAQVTPWLESLRQGGRDWLDMPAFGFTREHQQRWQRLAQAQVEYQQQAQAFQALMAEATQDAFRRFEDKLAERSAPGRQLQSARALFDLWIDAAEEAYAEVALSPRFRETYGAMTNAQMRLRTAVQREIEQASEALGVPTRAEVDAAHRKVARLEREVRRLLDLVERGGEAGDDSPGDTGTRAGVEETGTGRPRSSPTKSAARKPARATSKQSVAKRKASKPTAPKPASSKQASSKPAASRQDAPDQPGRGRTTAPGSRSKSTPRKAR